MYRFFRFFLIFKKSYISLTVNPEKNKFIANLDNYSKKNSMYVHYYRRFWKQTLSAPIANLVSGIFINTPKQQLFMTLFKQRLLCTVSAGFIRILTKFEKKCYKKRKVVVISTVRLFLKMVFMAKFPKPSFVRVCRCVPILPVLVSEFKKSKFSKKVNYFIFEPKLNFGVLDRQKKAAIKKKIKKNKLPSIEQF